MADETPEVTTEAGAATSPPESVPWTIKNKPAKPVEAAPTAVVEPVATEPAPEPEAAIEEPPTATDEAVEVPPDPLAKYLSRWGSPNARLRLQHYEQIAEIIRHYGGTI